METPMPKAKTNLQTGKKAALSRQRAKKAARGKPAAGTPFEVPFNPKKQLRKAAKKMLPELSPLPRNLQTKDTPDVLNRLWDIISSRKDADPEISHSARLMARGTARIAQKLGEEAVECLIEVMGENRPEVVSESADLLYHLLLTWAHLEIRPEEIWAELRRREEVSHMIEGGRNALKRLIGSVKVGTTKIP